MSEQAPLPIIDSADVPKPGLAPGYSDQLQPNMHGIELTPNGAEFQLGNTSYTYHGPTHNGMVLSSVAEDGITRPVIVYRSNSGGSDRVSQGYEPYVDKQGKPKRRLMKGPEQSPEAQYTQDTQLHPELDEKVGYLQEIAALRNMPSVAIPSYNETGADWLLNDFDKQMQTIPLGGNVALDRELHTFRANRLSAEDVEDLTGFDPATNEGLAAGALFRRVAKLNALLEESGVMPDFSQEPIAVGLTDNPQLGDVVKEVFEKSAGDLTYQWHMMHDTNGRAWVERIRIVESEVSAYGTDKQMVYSGVLTSKPVDYDSQADGIPAAMRQDLGNGYTDITAFLQNFAPIQQYSQHYARRNELYHFSHAA